MKEKTFKELVREKVVNVMGFNVLIENEVIQLLQQVREATGNEFLKALEGVELPMVTTMKIMAIMSATDRINENSALNKPAI